MKKIMAVFLAVMLMSLSISAISFAEGEREEVLQGFISNDITAESTLFKNYLLGLKTIKSVEDASTTDSTTLSIISYNSTDYAADNGRGIIVRYDISDVPADADVIKVSIAVTKRNSNKFYDPVINNEFVLGVYALEGLGNNWTRKTTPWSALFDEGTTPLTRSQIFSNRVSEIINNKEGYYDEPETGVTNLPLNGRRLLADVTEYVKAKKAAGANTIDLLFAPESHGSDPDDHTSLTLNFESITYSYSAQSEANGRLFRPGVLWYNVENKDTDNTIKSISVTNGVLADEFNSQDSSTVYTIAITDGSQPVSIEPVLNSRYASVGDNAVLSGQAGDTLIVPVVSESGETKTYSFKIRSYSGMPTIDYSFRGFYDEEEGGDDTVHTFLFGYINSLDNCSEFGIKAKGANNSEYNIPYTSQNIANINSTGKFGFAIKDLHNILGSCYSVVPYAKYAGDEEYTYGNKYNVYAYNMGSRFSAVEESGSVYAQTGTTLGTGTGSVVLGDADIRDHNLSFNTSSRVSLFRFDVTDVDVDADEIYFTFGNRGRSEAIRNFSPENNFLINIYGVDAVNDWTINSNMAEITAADDTASDAIAGVLAGEPVGTVLPKDSTENDKGIDANNPYPGYILKADITEYVKAQKNAQANLERQYVTVAIRYVEGDCTSLVYIKGADEATRVECKPTLYWK